MAARHRVNRPALAFAHDIVMAAVSFVLSLYLRVGRDFPQYLDDFLAVNVATFTLVAAVVFAWMRPHRSVWRYASLTDLIAIARAVTLVILIFLPAMFVLTRLESLPRSMLVINWFVLMILLGAPRILYRAFKEGSFDLAWVRGGADPRAVPVLLIGGGDGAELFIRALDRGLQGTYRVVGIVDVAGTRVGRHIRGVEVLGDVDSLAAVIQELESRDIKPQRLIVTDDRLDGAVISRLVETAAKLGLSVARVPRLIDFHVEQGEGVRIRPIAIEDLLGRPRAVLDRAAIARMVAGRRVMITGAGGTIGGELARQIAALGPSRMALLDLSEYNLYAIDLELAEMFASVPRRAILGDIRDRARMAALIEDEKPDLVFHAAALKHVPIVEAQPEDGVIANVVGTRNVADACRAARVQAMVMISTDKAVNPVGVMGATKRLAESYCQALDVAGGRGVATRFVTVRFGNVLGSTGSVVPLFQRQLIAGGPITITHPDMQRYFMTTGEAVELVLQASALAVAGGGTGAAGDGKIFVLDMGAPVRIEDLARQMIRLAGLRPDVDIQIAYTGLRPGERLFEELFHDAEALAPTPVKGILLAAPRMADHVILSRGIDELEEAARAGRRAKVLDLLAHLVPEYGRGRTAERRAATER